MTITSRLVSTTQRHLTLSTAVLALTISSCGGGGGGNDGVPAQPVNDTPPANDNPVDTPDAGFRLALCDAEPYPSIQPFGLPPELEQSGGCVVNYSQKTTDQAYIDRFGTDTYERRYLVYAPDSLSTVAAPVVFMFHGGDGAVNGESSASLYTHTRFEQLADENNFIVVYGNGMTNGVEDNQIARDGGFFHGCFYEHSGEGIDVQYVREILDQLATELAIDRDRVYATGLSASGGMALQLALEAPDIVAAVAPVAPLPWHTDGAWLHQCNPHEDAGTVSIAMYAATADRFIPYQQGMGIQFPDNSYPGMEETRDHWLAQMGIAGEPTVEVKPNSVSDDAYEPYTGVTDSTVEVYRYPTGVDGVEYWFYKADHAGHWWPNPTQIVDFFWEDFGKTNQDIDFADEAWTFFQRHSK